MKDHPVLETNEENDPHWTEEIEKGKVDSEIAALRDKVEAGDTSKYAIQERWLYYLSERDKVRPRLYVTRSLRLEILEAGSYVG